MDAGDRRVFLEEYGLERLGSMKVVRDAGLFRLEAREYVIKDGDVVSFRFNV